MGFDEVVKGLKAGKRFARAGWNGKGMFVFLVNGSTFKVNREPLLSILGEGTEVNYHGHVDMKTADGKIVPWLCSQTDLLAEDWTTPRLVEMVIRGILYVSCSSRPLVQDSPPDLKAADAEFWYPL